MNGSYEGNRTDTIILKDIKAFHLLGKGATSVSLFNLVLNSYYLYEPIEIREVNLTSSSFSFNTHGNSVIISYAFFRDSSIRTYDSVVICNSTFHNTTFTVSYGIIKLLDFATFYTSSISLRNRSTIKVTDYANIIFCEDYTCEEPGDITWDTPKLWLNISRHKNGSYSEIKVSDNCPPGNCLEISQDYCDIIYDNYIISSSLIKTLQHQCSEHHTGDLCGKCTDSLGIGYSGCLECKNNNSLAFLILFAAAGPLLIIVISILNLTVTQGVINGVIFYANIVWAYKSFFLRIDSSCSNDIYFPLIINPLVVILAWLNLDFGVPTCFAKGLTAPVKHFLEFLFPFYIATLFFVGLRYSDKLSKLLGS